ncbi:MAG TPA: ABC transporter permease [Gaiellaceae bacterium]|nr:ABC transporter permease [Gaiellaceae bacterium]
MDRHFVSLLLVSAVGLAAPLLFAALGEVVSETAGVINIELEGMMLAGAFCGVWGAFESGNVAVGFLAAAAGGILVAGAHGVVCFVFRANQVVSGVVLNVLVLGLTTFGLAVVFESNLARQVSTLENLRIPGLASVPVVGRAFFDQDAGVYAAFLLVPVLWFVLNRTALGLALKAVGERPQAAESLGLRVNPMRWAALLACGALAGVGGAQLTLAGLGAFTQNVTAGRGFIALAAVVFGRWRPVGTMAAVLLFAVADALQIRAQALGIHIPYQFLVMLPYLVTILALAGLVRRMRPPAYLGVNYQRE